MSSSSSSKGARDAFGNRMKSYEDSARFMRQLPVVLRIDGKCFSKFTKGLERPYDERLTNLMIEVTKYLVDELNAVIGYTQSDEISLILYNADPFSEIIFGGKKQKLISVPASMATAKFNELRQKLLPDFKVDKIAIFDCRAFQVPTLTEAANAILWREQDATKNAISMAARAFISHKQMQNLNGKQLQEILWSDFQINFNDYPNSFKRGTFVRKRFDEEICRTVLETIQDMPSFGKVTNREAVIFENQNPTTLYDEVENDSNA